MSPKVRANIVPAIPLCKNRTGKTAYLSLIITFLYFGLTEIVVKM